ncbi:ciliogenesis-associated TTC17-interacting protein [Rhynchophorus ferrugineus]|uniref:ciliogenesis-associated TTC17-interacting protein n=1 Tax=Rhynchophorus ferrugineus TaxID=354439 RepID=UPI003FCD787E
MLPYRAIVKQLCFRELLIISNIDQPISKLQEQSSECSVQSEEEKLRKYESFLEEQILNVTPKFVVHLSSEFDVDGKNAGSRIVSWVDQQFHTLEERRTEFSIILSGLSYMPIENINTKTLFVYQSFTIKFKKAVYLYTEPNKQKNTIHAMYIFGKSSELTQQILYCALQENAYYVKHTSLEQQDSRKYYPLSKTKDFVGEGANFILMRYLAITKYKGNFELSTMYINGDMCRNIYECKGPKPGFVNKNKTELCKIYRTIIEECGLVHTSVTVLTIFGMIVSHEWEGCPYIFHINPIMVTTGKPIPFDAVYMRKAWEADIELVSKYLDCKAEAELNMKTYLKDHPEIEEMVGDYLQSLLLLKPENILPFTMDYFTNFQPFQLPQMPYFNNVADTDKDENEIFW